MAAKRKQQKKMLDYEKISIDELRFVIMLTERMQRYTYGNK